jgi:ABC-type nitrate/sulfonate/bicarbonate transport system substrate-binding protein
MVMGDVMFWVMLIVTAANAIGIGFSVRTWRGTRRLSDRKAMERARELMQADPKILEQFVRAVAERDRKIDRDRAAAIARRDQGLSLLRENRAKLERMSRGELQLPDDLSLACGLACFVMGELVMSEADAELLGAASEESGAEAPSAGEGGERDE